MAKKVQNVAKKAVAIVTADWHFQRGSLEDRLSLVEQIVELSTDKGAAEVWILGDLVQARAAQPLEVLVGLSSAFDMLTKHNNVIIVVPGNHDKVDLTSDESYIDLYGYKRGIVVATKPRVFYKENIDTAIAIVPFYSSEYYAQALTQVVSMTKQFGAKHNVLLTHNAFAGAKNNDGTFVGDGALSLKDVGGAFDLILTGHYHDRQVIGNKLVYVGGMSQQTFGEDTNKGALVLYDDLSYEFVNFNFRKKLTLIFDADSADDIAAEAKRFVAKMHNDADFRVKVLGSKDRVGVVKALYVQGKLGQAKFEFITGESADAINAARAGSVTSYTDSSIVDEFEAFCLEHSYDTKEGLELMASAGFEHAQQRLSAIDSSTLKRSSLKNKKS